MGKFEDKIKEELLKDIYSKIIEVYEFVDTRYSLSDIGTKKLIEELNACNESVAAILKDEKLS